VEKNSKQLVPSIELATDKIGSPTKFKVLFYKGATLTLIKRKLVADQTFRMPTIATMFDGTLTYDMHALVDSVRVYLKGIEREMGKAAMIMTDSDHILGVNKIEK
jgi:hypothetical protein